MGIVEKIDWPVHLSAFGGRELHRLESSDVGARRVNLSDSEVLHLPGVWAWVAKHLTRAKVGVLGAMGFGGLEFVSACKEGGFAMGFWTLLQILAHVVTFASLIYVFFSLRRPAKDDPRMSRGLQLLQSKIAVLEDLSDRTDTQVHQLQALLSQRSKDVETLLQRLDSEMAKIQQATQKSLEVAEIFQDRIPHKEIIERQTTTKYVRAAQLAHAGKTVDEIARSVDLSVGEIELIAKMNREQLQFSEAALPEWIQKSPPLAVDVPVVSAVAETGHASKDSQISGLEEAPLLKETPQALAQLGERMRKALKSGDSDLATPSASYTASAPSGSAEAGLAEAVESSNRLQNKQSTEGPASAVKPYSFPRASIRDSLA